MSTTRKLHPMDVDAMVEDLADEMGLDPDSDFMQCVREELEAGQTVIVERAALHRALPTTAKKTQRTRKRRRAQP